MRAKILRRWGGLFLLLGLIGLRLQAQQTVLFDYDRTQLAAGGAERELRALETARTEAIRAGDAATLEKIYADDFRGVTSAGQTVDKARILEVLKGAAGGLPAEIQDQEIRIFDEIAVVTGLIRLSALSQEGRVPVNSFRYTHIYARRDGRWRMVAGQSTNVPR